MYFPDGLLSYSPEATEARKYWSLVYDESKKLVILYQSLLLFYIQAYFRDDWFSFVRHNPCETWDPVEVLDEARLQKRVLEFVGATEDLLETISKLRKWFREEPKDSDDRESFCILMTSLIDDFPVRSLREKEERPLRGPSRYLLTIKPNYYSTKMRLEFQGSDLKSFMDLYLEYSQKEFLRVDSLNSSQLWDERRLRVGIPEDVDPFDPWYQAIFFDGQDATSHRARMKRDEEIVRLLKPMLHKGLKRQWEEKWEEVGGTVASQEEIEPADEEGMIHWDRDDSSKSFTRTFGIHLELADSSPSSSSSSSSSRKRRPEDIAGPSQPRDESPDTSPSQRKKTKTNK